MSEFSIAIYVCGICPRAMAYTEDGWIAHQREHIMAGEIGYDIEEDPG